MKTLILFTTALLATSAFAREFDVVIHPAKSSPYIDQMELDDLISSDSFDGKYFKVVRGKDKEAVKFNADEELTLRAATTYYHLTKARNFFVDRLKSEYVKKMEKVVIRIDHKNQFSELGHFAHDNLNPGFNNALTVPAGRGMPGRNIEPWGIEIWFRPQKTVHLSEIQVHDFNAATYAAMVDKLKTMIHMQTLNRFVASSLSSIVQGGSNPFTPSNLFAAAVPSVIMEFGARSFMPMAKLFQRKWYWLETALIPEIIYHEFSHAALSDSLVLSHSTAIIEGMADYFAGHIADSPELATHIKEYNTFNGKDAEKKQQYMLQFEMQEAANTDFVFGLLWAMDDIVGEENGPEFMYALRNKLTTNSSIRDGLIEGLLKTCREKCKDKFNDRLEIQKLMNKKGI